MTPTARSGSKLPAHVNAKRGGLLLLSRKIAGRGSFSQPDRPGPAKGHRRARFRTSPFVPNTWATTEIAEWPSVDRCVPPSRPFCPGFWTRGAYSCCHRLFQKRDRKRALGGASFLPPCISAPGWTARTWTANACSSTCPRLWPGARTRPGAGGRGHHPRAQAFARHPGGSSPRLQRCLLDKMARGPRGRSVFVDLKRPRPAGEPRGLPFWQFPFPPSFVSHCPAPLGLCTRPLFRGALCQVAPTRPVGGPPRATYDRPFRWNGREGKGELTGLTGLEYTRRPKRSCGMYSPTLDYLPPH